MNRHSHSGHAVQHIDHDRPVWLFLERESSPNAPSTRDLLGTAMLAILAGYQRYAHISALRGDMINAPLLGMTAVVSEALKFISRRAASSDW